MKKKVVIISISLILTVLFSILFQSIHSFEHFYKQRSEKSCLHKYNSDKEITHQHHSLEHCFVCNVSFGNYITPVFYSFQVYFENTTIPYFYNTSEKFIVFSGSNFSLRGPPQFIA